MSDDIFLTPQLRTGPTSRLLRRRSQMQPQKLEVTAMPDSMDVTTTSQRDLEFHVSFKLFQIFIIIKLKVNVSLFYRLEDMIP